MRLSAEEYKKSRVKAKVTIDRNDVGLAILYFACFCDKSKSEVTRFFNYSTITSKSPSIKCL